MICNHISGVWSCTDDNGVPIPSDDPQVIEFIQAFASMTHAPQAPRIDATVIAERRTTCNACDQYNSETDRCRACGCGDHMGRRVQSPFATCPMKRWPLHLPANP